MRLQLLGSLIVVTSALACGGNQTDAKTASDGTRANTTPSATPSTSAPSAPAPSSAPSASSLAATPATEEPNPAAKRPLEVTSECADVVHIVYGDDPKAPAKTAIAQGGRVDAPRRPDGTQVVNRLDDSGEGIAKVTITRHMKHVVIGRSCRTIDAH